MLGGAETQEATLVENLWGSEHPMLATNFISTVKLDVYGQSWNAKEEEDRISVGGSNTMSSTPPPKSIYFSVKCLNNEKRYDYLYNTNLNSRLHSIYSFYF